MAKARELIRHGVSAAQTLQVIAAAALLALTLGAQAIGLPSYCVLSGSMEPTIPVGSLVYVDASASPAQVAVGDAIAFKSGDAIVVHRVVSTDEQSLSFTTKGDANDEVDSARVPYSSFIGIARGSIPGLGSLLVALDSNRTAAMVIVAAANIALCAIAWLAKREPRIRKCTAQKGLNYERH